MQCKTTLETWQVLFICDAMHPGTCRHCNMLCEQDKSEISAFSVNIAQSEEFIASTDNNYHQHLLDIHMKSGGFSL